MQCGGISPPQSIDRTKGEFSQNFYCGREKRMFEVFRREKRQNFQTILDLFNIF